MKARGLLILSQDLNWLELPNIAAKSFLGPSELGLDPLGLIREVFIPRPRSKLLSTSKNG